MAHKYYCTYCAKELNQDLVLIDMEYALTVSAADGDVTGRNKGLGKLQLLKFRVTVQQFEDLIDRGTVCNQNYTRIDLPIEELAGYMANEYNLNDPAIARLTLEDIDKYLKSKYKRDSDSKKHRTDDERVTSDRTGAFDGDIFAAAEKHDSWEAVKASTAVKGDEQIERMLEEDLSLLRNLVDDRNGCIPITIYPDYEEADTGDDILVGYYARRGRKTIKVDARVCDDCGTPVFKHAGAAVHRAVTFIGEEKSGKTSTILALTSYAISAAEGALPVDEIWGGSSGVPGIKFMNLVDKKSVLMDDLAYYEIGVAPKKTSAQQRKDAYSSTLWIVNSAGRKFILTLIDLPGELCKPDGTVDGDKILNEFPVATASDVFIMCFDTTRAQGPAAAKTVSRTCSWASEFQKLRQDYKRGSVIRELGDNDPEPNRNCIAPMIVVFTKCEELESGEPEMREERNHFNPRRVDEVYSLKVEREFINRNPIYKDVGRKIQIYEDLENAYVARLRVSPFGFAAPQKPDYEENNSLNKNPDGTIRYPRPKHVDELMKWLLGLIGCIPIEAEFCPNPSVPERVYRLRDCYVKRPQYRIWEPQGRSKKEKQDEAMCRAYLFENYTKIDEEYINNVFERPNVFEQPAMSSWRWTWPKKKRNS